ncbi:MAG: hypothetical protein ACKPKO_57345, partial [Candidatus Fonsibacter sp.]
MRVHVGTPEKWFLQLCRRIRASCIYTYLRRTITSGPKYFAVTSKGFDEFRVKFTLPSGHCARSTIGMNSPK